MADKSYPVTPDGRYFLVKDRLWRCTNPNLPEAEREALVNELMAARSSIKTASTEQELKAARQRVHAAKVGLGERGMVWWDDAAPDVNRYHPKNTPYAKWWQDLTGE